jgi:hypothetical protein
MHLQRCDRVPVQLQFRSDVAARPWLAPEKSARVAAVEALKVGAKRFGGGELGSSTTHVPSRQTSMVAAGLAPGDQLRRFRGSCDSYAAPTLSGNVPHLICWRKLMDLILLIVVLFLVFGGGGYWGYRRWR